MRNFMWVKRLLKYLVGFFILSLLFLGLFLGSVYIGIFGPLPDKQDLIGITNEQASLVLSNNGNLIGKYFAENRTNISWEETPQNLVDALIATEDKRFFEHQGIDSRSYLRVFFKTILLGNKSSGGGSTITQQLVKNLYGRNSHSFLSMPVSKVKEAIIASRMEDVLSKEEIILLYLNSVPFGEEVYGIQAAAKRYFDKNAIDLKVEESAVLVGMLKANTYYNPRLHPDHATNRRNQVLDLMANEDFITVEKANKLKESVLDLNYTNYQLESEAGYFVYQVKKRANAILEDLQNSQDKPYSLKKDGLRIYTTIDIKLQKIANKAALKQISRMQVLLDKELAQYGTRKKWEKIKNLDSDWKKKENRAILTFNGIETQNISKADSLWHYYKMLNAAVLATDPNTGAVLVWTGGNNFRYLPYDLILAERQMASTIKPFIYTAALEAGFEPCNYFDNSLKEYEDYENWKPENYDKSHSEEMKVAMWYALSHSLNLPTVDLYFETGHEEVANTCRRLGLDAPYEETPSLALGALDASLYDIVKAYGSFANNGFLVDELIMIEKITDANGQIIYENKGVEKSKIITSTTSEQITAMLELAINEGTGIRMRNTYGIKTDLAGKTGTAQNYSDAWFISYTPSIVLGTWVGARSPKMHFRGGLGSGSSLALPISGEIISSIEKQSSLKRKYITNFSFAAETTVAIDCDAFWEKGVTGAFNRFIGTEPNDTDDKKSQDIEKPKEERNKVQKFFDNIFGKKKRSKNKAN